MVTCFSLCFAKDKFYLFGGQDQDKPWKNQLIVLDKSLKPLETLELSTKREGHTCAVIRDKLYIFGGSKNKGPFTFCFDLEKKEEIQLNEVNPPSERKDHTTVVYNDKIYLFAGKSLDKNPKFNNELHEFDPTTSKWKLISVPSPISRSGHAACLNEHEMIIHGGYFQTNQEVSYFKDTYSFNLQKFEWKKLSFEGELLLAREGHDMILKEKNILLIGGGWIPENQSFQLFQLNLNNNTSNLVSFKGESKYKSKMLYWNNQLYFVGGKGVSFDEFIPIHLEWLQRKRERLPSTIKPKQVKNNAPSKKILSDTDFKNEVDSIDVPNKDFEQLVKESKIEEKEDEKKSFVPPKGAMNPFGGFVPPKGGNVPPKGAVNPFGGFVPKKKE